MIEKLLLVFGVSLVGSLHCAGMCGPLAACAMGVGSNAPRRTAAVANLNYQLGRLTSYTLLGVLCGVLGAAANLSGSLVGFQRAAAILSGVLMIGLGLLGIARAYGFSGGKTKRSFFIQRAVNRGLQWATRFPLTRRALLIGLLTAMLPCGWLWIFFAAAAGTADPVFGALVMVAFWLGTVPVLAGLGQLAASLWGAARPRLATVMSVLIILLGLWTLVHRSPVALARSQDTLDLTPSDLQTTPACCQPDE